MDGIHLQQTQHLGGITAQMNQLQLQPATAQQQQQFSIQQQQQRVVGCNLNFHFLGQKFNLQHAPD